VAPQLRRPPPALEETDPRYPGKDPRYQNLTKQQLPLTECLKDTVARVLPCWHDLIAPNIRSGKQVLIAAHGNSLRALVMYLENIPEQEIVDLNIPTGVPLVMELDDNLTFSVMIIWEILHESSRRFMEPPAPAEPSHRETKFHIVFTEDCPHLTARPPQAGSCQPKTIDCRLLTPMQAYRER